MSEVKKLRLGLLFMFLCTLLVFATDNVVSARVLQGKVGPSADWSIDTDTGLLTISGIGKTMDYEQADDVPWAAYRGSDILKIIVKDGITGIGSCLFMECSSAAQIQLPSSVKTIGKNAFFACNNMVNITLPAGIPEIGSDTFAYCSSLTQITIPKSVVRIGNGAFRSCDSLKSFTLERGSLLAQAGENVFKVLPTEPWNNARQIRWYSTDTTAASVMRILQREWDAYVAEGAPFTCNWQWTQIAVRKAANPLAIKDKTASLSFKKLKKKAQTLSASKVIRFKAKGQGTLRYALAAAKKGGKSFIRYFKINAGTGKITVKKGLKKGTYKVKIKVKAAGNAYYQPSDWKTVTSKLKVK